MIKRTELLEAGRFNKPHGIKGEISVTLDIDADLSAVKCIVVEIEGLFVPFFIASVRPKTADTSLVTIDGIDSDEQVREFVNRTIYLLRDDEALQEDDDDEDGDYEDDGFYASDLIGFKVIDDEQGQIGTITDVNDSTANILFVITDENGREILVPVADEFITSVDPETETLTTSIPPEIVNLN